MSAEYSAEFLKPQTPDDQESHMGKLKRDRKEWLDNIRDYYDQIKTQKNSTEVIQGMGALASSAGGVGLDPIYIEMPRVEQDIQPGIAQVKGE